MKRTILIISALLAIVSCAEPQKYQIFGEIETLEGDRDPNGYQIFLVPLHDQSREAVDSVVVKDNKFYFEGTECHMADIRMSNKARYGYQNLLVVTEPGKIKVHIGPVSHGGGTPQNDSLQVWKNLTEEKNHFVAVEPSIEARREFLRKYSLRSQDMARNLPEGPLKEFLNQYFPKK